MAEVDAWLAGLIDGEGSIMLVRRKSGHWRPVVSIANTDLRLMEALQERIGGGRVYMHRLQPQHNHKRTSYTWRMTSAEMRIWLPRAMPWLVCKREQAELLLEALEIKAGQRPVVGRQSVRGTERMDGLALAIKTLNRKGREVVL